MLLVHTGLISAAPVGKRTWRRQRGLLLGPAAQDRGRSPRVAGSSPSSRPVSVTHRLLLPSATYRLFARSVAPPPGGACSFVQMWFGRFFLCAAPVPPLSSLPRRLPPPPPSSGRRAGPGVVPAQILSGPWSWTPDFCILGSSLMMMADSDSDSGVPEGFSAAAPW